QRLHSARARARPLTPFLLGRFHWTQRATVAGPGGGRKEPFAPTLHVADCKRDEPSLKLSAPSHTAEAQSGWLSRAAARPARPLPPRARRPTTRSLASQGPDWLKGVSGADMACRSGLNTIDAQARNTVAQ